MNPEMEALKARLKATWMSGDYGHFSKYLESGALEFMNRLNLAPGMRLLDVACGAGQLAIPAARAGIQVTGVDIATNLVLQARARAAAEGLSIHFDEGDAESLPYPDAKFDVVVSLIGAMFAPQANRVADELLRVCRSGGRIVMANWTADGHVGQMFRAIGCYVPPSPLMDSPLKWGDEEVVRQRFGAGASRISTSQLRYPMIYPFPPAEVVEFFGSHYGPMIRALAVLDASTQAKLKRELVELWTMNNISRDARSTHVEATFLEVDLQRA